MAENLDWFNRVFNQLEDGETFENEDGYELFEVFGDCIIFRKELGHRHPIIELYDLDDSLRIAHICFDPYNQQFYLPVNDEEIGKKLHFLLDSFDDIKHFFIGAWINQFSNEDEEELEEYDFFDNSEDIFDAEYEYSEPEEKIFHHLTAMLLEHKNNVDMDKEKLNTIEWLDEEELISSLKLDIPVSIEQQIVLKLGIIPETKERVLCKETRFLYKTKVTHGSSQLFLINQDELRPLLEMVKKHWL